MRRVHIHMHMHMHMGLGTAQKAAYTVYEYKLLWRVTEIIHGTRGQRTARKTGVHVPRDVLTHDDDAAHAPSVIGSIGLRWMRGRDKRDTKQLKQRPPAMLQVQFEYSN